MFVDSEGTLEQSLERIRTCNIADAKHELLKVSTPKTKDIILRVVFV